MKQHLPEYFAEFVGTAIMMTVGIGAVTFMWSSGSAMREIIPSDALRRLATGILFAGGGTAVVLSPLGQRSGGHLNPAVTLAFWWQNKVPTRDAVFYVLAQIFGALAGVCIVALVAGDAARSVQFGLTAPGAGYSTLAALGAEFTITFLLVALILFCVGNERFARFTPYLVGALVAFLVFVEAPVSGTSLNPARSLAPAVLARICSSQWIYWAGPLLGSIAAAVTYNGLARKPNAGCAKLYHTGRHRCIFLDCRYTQLPAGGILVRQGEAADTAFVIESGEVEVRRTVPGHGDHAVARLGAGEWVGELGLLLKQPRSATVVALKDSKVREVSAENFAHVIAEHPDETVRLLRQLAQRLYETDSKLQG